MPPRSRYAVDPSLASQPPRDTHSPPPAAAASAYSAQTPPANHIAPPPHSIGPALSGPRVRIDPSQIPNPVEAQELDQNLWDEEDFESCNAKGLIPLAGTDYRGIDQGNSLPRHLRATLAVVPSNSQLLDTAALPLAIVAEPFAPLRYDEAPVPLVSSWTSGESAFAAPAQVDEPPRCEQCRGYISPFVIWHDGGRTWACHLCGSRNQVPDAYFSPITTGYRADHAERPELLHGTIDILAPASYHAQMDRPDLLQAAESAATELVGIKGKQRRLRTPRPIGRVFVIDASTSAVQRGVLAEVCEAIRVALYGDDEFAGEVAIVTVGEAVHFWNLSAQPVQMVVTDLDDVFVPLRDGFLVDSLACRAQIETLLAAIPRMDHGARCALGAGVQGALAGLLDRGGQILLFTAGLPSLGPGRLEPIASAYNEERSLLSPDVFWRQTADELAEHGVGLTALFFPEQYTGVASIGHLAVIAGGENLFYPRFEPVRDRLALQRDLDRIIKQETGYNATCRIRCSKGLRAAEYYGHFFQRSMTEVEVGWMGESSALGATLVYEGKLEERAYVQVACLYTSGSGERRVRILNLQLGVTSLIGNVFRFADLDAIVSLHAKQAVGLVANKALKDVRGELTTRCNKILLMYRRHCAAAVQAGQLILPESLKLLPLYTLCINKTKALKGGTVTPDVRMIYARRIRSAGINAIMALLYPRILAFHDLAEGVGFEAQGRLKLPSLQRASYGWMVAEGAYLMVNGEVAMVWLGAAVSPQILDDLWGVDALEDLDTRMTQLPKLPTLLSAQIRNILTHFERVYGRSLPLTIVRQNMDGMEIEYANALVEDCNNDALSYTDYLMTAHKSITNDLAGKAGWL